MKIVTGLKPSPPQRFPSDVKEVSAQYYYIINTITTTDLLSATERRGTPVLLSALVSDNSGNSPQISTRVK